MAISERIRAAVANNGRLAARAGLAVTDCPFAAQTTPMERALAGIWVRHYLAARPPLPAEIHYDEE